ncbi:MAG: peptide chain release factor 1 [Planctomycetota bacterium]|jgi:peptide chain release factor 1
MAIIIPAIVEKLRERAARYSELTEEISKPEVASDPKLFPDLLKERGQLESSFELAGRLEKLFEDRVSATEMLEDDDSDMREMAEEELKALDEAEVSLERDIKTALVEDPELNRSKVIVEVRAGAGGDEATLFAGDLFRMYLKYCETHKWKVEILEQTESDVGGYKEIVFGVKGTGVWRLFRFESGGHRVQRVPSTETQGRIHTSAATVAVLPEAEEVEIDIKTDELRIDTMRSSGPGGQSVNKTSSAVRMTHLPTGTVVCCQDEKSQHKNRAKAMRILRARLFEAETRAKHEARAAVRKEQVGTGDRSERIRTYNFPQNRVSDHRLGANFSLDPVVAGKLDPILEALEERDRDERIKAL